MQCKGVQFPSTSVDGRVVERHVWLTYAFGDFFLSTTQVPKIVENRKHGLNSHIKSVGIIREPFWHSDIREEREGTETEIETYNWLYPRTDVTYKARRLYYLCFVLFSLFEREKTIDMCVRQMTWHFTPKPVRGNGKRVCLHRGEGGWEKMWYPFFPILLLGACPTLQVGDSSVYRSTNVR